ncbi:MAG: hypothetical protein H2076_10810, partial [Planctomycetes bacterium]|nr:hypothetical protein [Planctomycetota bacterium]
MPLWIKRALVLLPLMVLSLAAEAQTADRLARLQEEAREYLRSLQVQMESLAERLDAEIPEDSEKLRSARQKIIQDLIEDDMRAVTEALTGDDYVKALETIRKVRSNLELVLSILESRNIDPQQLDSDLDKVSQRLEAVRQLSDSQRSLLEKTRRSEEAAQDAEDLQRMQDDLGDLISEQQQLSQREPEPQQGSPLSTQAAEISEGVRNLADRMARESRRLQGLSAISRQISGLEEALSEQMDQIAGGEQSSNSAQARQARQQASESRSVSERIGALRREAQADAEAGDEGAEQILQDLEEARAALQEAAEEAEQAAGQMQQQGSAGVPRGGQQAALQRARQAIERALDQDGERSAEIESSLGEWTGKLEDWLE